MTQSPQPPPPTWYQDPGDPTLLRYWDGMNWTDQTTPNPQAPDDGVPGRVPGALGGLLSKGAAALQQRQGSGSDRTTREAAGFAAEMQSGVDPNAQLYEFESHVDGRNARVRIFADRVEWDRPRGVSAAKVTAGIMTLGASLLATGVKGKGADSEFIPIKSISSVTTKRDGMRYSKVTVIVSGNTIDFRVTHSEAEEAKRVLMQLVLGNHPAQAAAQAAATPVAQPIPPAAPQPSGPAPAPAAPDLAEQLTKLKGLLDAGILTQEEFDAKKAQILASM